MYCLEAPLPDLSPPRAKLGAFYSLMGVYQHFDLVVVVCWLRAKVEMVQQSYTRKHYFEGTWDIVEAKVSG